MATPFGDGRSEITKLKNLCIETTLLADGCPKAVIVAPSSGRHDSAVKALQNRIAQGGGQELPVLRDDEGSPESLLVDRSVITLGNMSTSRFIESLYRQWYTLLDLRYPGPGGSVVRSLHNPFATGNNVILLGGSDDEGVEKAVGRFSEILADGDPLRLGWLMEVELGEGMDPPGIGEQVYGWRDSWRVDSEGNETGYPPAGTFGWHPISIQAALYYMTGQGEYLREFVRLALPDPDDIPKEVLTCSAFYSMEHPLVENYHYHAHTMALLWDLIEESPLLSDDVRLRITNELRGHQDYIDADDTLCPPRAPVVTGCTIVCAYTRAAGTSPGTIRPRDGRSVSTTCVGPSTGGSRIPRGASAIPSAGSTPRPSPSSTTSCWPDRSLLSTPGWPGP